MQSYASSLQLYVLRPTAIFLLSVKNLLDLAGPVAIIRVLAISLFELDIKMRKMSPTWEEQWCLCSCI